MIIKSLKLSTNNDNLFIYVYTIEKNQVSLYIEFRKIEVIHRRDYS
jgi:hypothetical protein